MIRKSEESRNIWPKVDKSYTIDNNKQGCAALAIGLNH